MAILIVFSANPSLVFPANPTLVLSACPDFCMHVTIIVVSLHLPAIPDALNAALFAAIFHITPGSALQTNPGGSLIQLHVDPLFLIGLGYLQL